MRTRLRRSFGSRGQPCPRKQGGGSPLWLHIGDLATGVARYWLKVPPTRTPASTGPSYRCLSPSAVQEVAVPYSDVVAAARISSGITSAGLTPVLRPTTRTSLNDLQQGPVVMIGIDNDWTLRLTGSLPFQFVKAGENGAYEILDARSATAPTYSIGRDFSALSAISA